ncbi:uncharacterized protein LOC129884259 [Solanum dulcamara]|uniref:uncharacterized protein LOC129884259 n=1 Tax=Solanum dulcamara TaxID=45834 RepID=UPI0024855E6C|nr:uncharacterized protein LOC129884259 [Solanum dulcamara]
MTNISQLVDLHSTSIKKLVHQMSQLSITFNQRKTITLPSDVVKNPRKDGQCMAVTTRSDKEDRKDLFDDDDEADEIVLEKKRTKENIGTKQTEEEGPRPVPPIRKTPPLFLHILKKRDEDGKCLKFILILKEISVNIPMVEALEQMPGYAKFIKDLFTTKRMIYFEPVDNLHHYSVVATRSLVEKKEDPGAFIIPCTIGAFVFAWDFCDLGAPKLTSMRLFIFPADFVIKDCQVDFEVHIILERPFFATDKALVDVEYGELIFRLNNEEFKFNPLAAVIMNFNGDGIEGDDDSFDFEVKDHKGSENQVVDHFSSLEDESRGKDELEIDDSFPNEQVLAANLDLIPSFADYANYLVSDPLPEDFTFHQKKFLHDINKYFWDERYLFRMCVNNVIKRCIPEAEMLSILEACHS